MTSLAMPHLLPRIHSRPLEFAKYTNLLLALAARRRQETQLINLPFEVTIDPTTVCQLRCPYCAVGAKTMIRTKGTLKEPTHAGLMDQFGDQLFVVWYFSTGEPLLNKRLGELVAQTRGREVFSAISTNLSLPLSDARIDELLTCGLGCICVSLDGASASTYVQYRRGGDFDLVVDNMRRLVQRKRELGLDRPYIEWRFLVFDHNYREISLARQLAADWQVDLLEFWPGSVPNSGKGPVRAAPSTTRRDPACAGPAWSWGLGRRDTPMRAQLAELPDAPEGSPPAAAMGRKCDWHYFGASLFPNGSVGPCCVSNDEPNDFGMMDAHTGFADVWNGDKFRAARARLGGDSGQGQELICARCPGPSSQDYQFRTSLQGILRNAPGWVLKVLASEPERYFHPVDAHLMPTELDAIQGGGYLDSEPDGEFLQWLGRHPHAAHPDLRFVAEAVSRPASEEPPPNPSILAEVLERRRVESALRRRLNTLQCGHYGGGIENQLTRMGQGDGASRRESVG